MALSEQQPPDAVGDFVLLSVDPGADIGNVRRLVGINRAVRRAALLEMD